MAADPEYVRRALALWDDFPVDCESRPIVFTAVTPQWQDRVADEVRRSSMLDAPSVSANVLSPDALAEAVKYCRDVNTLQPGPLGRIVRMPMLFLTDRGERRLPAWVMLPEDRRWPFVALDPDLVRSMTWRPAGLGVPVGTMHSALDDDGCTLHFRFGGSLPGVADYPDAVVTETDTAVHIEVIEQRLVGPGYVGPAVAVQREVMVRLAAPLGNRVLISTGHGPGTDTFGSPLTVIPTTLPDRIRAALTAGGFRESVIPGDGGFVVAYGVEGCPVAGCCSDRGRGVVAASLTGGGGDIEHLAEVLEAETATRARRCTEHVEVRAL